MKLLTTLLAGLAALAALVAAANAKLLATLLAALVALVAFANTEEEEFVSDDAKVKLGHVQCSLSKHCRGIIRAVFPQGEPLEFRAVYHHPKAPHFMFNLLYSNKVMVEPNLFSALAEPGEDGQPGRWTERILNMVQSFKLECFSNGQLLHGIPDKFTSLTPNAEFWVDVRNPAKTEVTFTRGSTVAYDFMLKVLNGFQKEYDEVESIEVFKREDRGYTCDFPSLVTGTSHHKGG